MHVLLPFLLPRVCFLLENSYSSFKTHLQLCLLWEVSPDPPPRLNYLPCPLRLHTGFLFIAAFSCCSIIVYVLFLKVENILVLVFRVAITKYHKLGGLKQQRFSLSTVLEAGKSKMKVLAGLCSL